MPLKESQMAQQGAPGPRIAPQNDLYTVLLITAGGVLLLGIIYLAARCSMLFGSIWPAPGG